MDSTLLSTIIARMQRWQSVLPTEEQFLVYDLDEAIRTRTRTYKFPWTMQKSTMRVFSDVLAYPTASDHLSLAYIDGQQKSYGEKPRPYYTSLIEFLQDPNNLSSVAEIWEAGTRYLGVRNKTLGGASQVIDTVNVLSNYTLSGSATASALDNVITDGLNNSVAVTVVDTTDAFLVEHTFTSFTDVNYRKKYYFRKVFMPATATSVTLRFGTDSSNYIYQTLTTQFSGQAIKADDWNLFAFDLNTGTAVGSGIVSSTFTYEAIAVTGVISGTYFLSQSSLKQWALMDYWYYSTKMVKSLTSSIADQDYFLDTSLVYSTDSALVGDENFADVIMYDALQLSLTDRENAKILGVFQQRSAEAWAAIKDRYPDIEPLIVTHGYRFGSQMGNVVKDYDQEAW